MDGHSLFLILKLFGVYLYYMVYVLPTWLCKIFLYIHSNVSFIIKAISKIDFGKTAKGIYILITNHHREKYTVVKEGSVLECLHKGVVSWDGRGQDVWCTCLFMFQQAFTFPYDVWKEVWQQTRWLCNFKSGAGLNWCCCLCLFRDLWWKGTSLEMVLP